MSNRGINVFDLLGWAAPGTNALLPDDVISLFERLEVIDYNSVTTESSYIHFGKVRVDDSVVGLLPTEALKLPEIPGNNFKPEAPELNRGVYFRLLFRRRPTAIGQNVEPPSSAWTFHLLMDPISFVTDFVPAQLIPSAGVSRSTLKPLNTKGIGNARARKHRFKARGAFRVAFDGDGAVDIGFANFPDPFDPDAPEGPVFEAWSDPPHFFVKDFVGVTIDKMTLDFSSTTTPPAVAGRGQPPAWKGIAIDEATVYGFDGRFLGPITLGVRDLILGMPFGLQGEAFAEYGRLPDAGVPELGPIDIFALIGGTETLLNIERSKPTSNEPDDQRLFKATLPTNGPAQVAARLRNPPPDTQATWVFDGSTLFDRNFDSTGDRQPGNKTAFVTVNAHDTLTLEARRNTTVDGEPKSVKTDSIHITFKPENAGVPDLRINLPDVMNNIDNVNGIDNVVSISGSPQALNGLRLVATGADLEGVRWEGPTGTVIMQGAEFQPTTFTSQDPEGMNFVQVRTKNGQSRRINVHLLASGSLIIGAQAGVFDKDGNPLNVHRLGRDFDLLGWHNIDKTFKHRETETGVDANGTIIVNGEPAVPDGAIAELYLKAGSLNEEPNVSADTDPNASSGPIQHVAVRFSFSAKNKPIAWINRPQDSGDAVTTADVGASEKILEDLVAWLSRRFGLTKEPKDNPDQVPAAGKILIIGRTDDIQDDEEFNKKLSEDRATSIRDAIKRHDSRLLSIVSARGEQTKTENDEFKAFEELLKSSAGLYFELDRQVFTSLSADKIGIDRHEAARVVLGPPTNLIPTANQPGAGDSKDFSLINRIYRPKLFNENPNKNSKMFDHLEPRPRYRRVDIFIQSPLPVEDSSASTADGEKNKDIDSRARITFVPGADVAVPVRKPKVDPKFPFLVRKTIAWDSPSYQSAVDAIPTKFECSFTWAHRTVKLPAVIAADPQEMKPCDEDQQTAEFFTVLGRMQFDSRTLETIINLSLASEGDPNGLYCTDIKELAAALAIGPALIPLVDDLGSEGAATLTAIAVASAAAVIAAEKGTVVLEKVEAEQRFRSISTTVGSTLRLGVDYRANVEWDFKLVRTAENTKVKKPGMEISYKNLGILIPTGAIPQSGPVDAEHVQLVYDDASINIKNPGQWEIGNELLGKLLRVSAARVGTGSAWIEVDLALALDLGAIHITKATVRASFKSESNIEVELRGLEVEIDIPGTLQGKGKLAVNPDGGLATALTVNVIPAGISVGASLALQDDFFLLQIDSQFSTPIPLFSTGLGVFGFSGRFAANGERNVSIGAASIPDRELAWFALPTENKYRPAPGKWAFGLGTVVGTLPDQGFIFNAKGMVTVAVPDLEVVLGVDGQFLRKPGEPTEEGDPVDAGVALRLKGLVVVNDDFVSLSIDGDYEYRKLLKLNIPVRGFFPFGGSDGFFLRVGSDNFAGDAPDFKNSRPGDPVTAVILPDSLKLKATAFMLIEEHGISKLGGKTEPIPFDFPGFAVGTGLTFRLEWGGKLIGVDVGAELLAGLGSNPLTVGAGIWIKGEVSFLLLSAGISGELIFYYFEGDDSEPGSDHLAIFGKLCARVGYWRFKKTKCGTVRIPEEPADIALNYPVPSPLKGIDLIGRNDQVIAAALLSTAGGEQPVVWPDTMPALHFTHPLHVELPGDSAFNPGDVAGATWVGSGDIKNAYRLKGVVLRPKNSPPISESLPSAWTFPSHRPSFGGAESPSIGDEHCDLHLLTDMKYRWGRNLVEGGLGIAADPVSSLENLCTPTPPALPACALGDSLFRLPGNAVRLTTKVPSPPPFSTSFSVVTEEPDAELLSVLLGDDGYQSLPGFRVPIPNAGGSEKLHGARFMYLLPQVMEQDRLVTTLPVESKFNGELVRPQIILSLCDRPRASNPGLQCDTYEDLTQDFVFQSLSRFGLKYESIHQGTTTGFMFTTTVAGQRGIRITGIGTTIQLPVRTNRVRAQVIQLGDPSDDVEPGSFITMVAKNRSGTVIQTDQIQNNDFGQIKTLNIQVSSSRIASVELKGAFNRTHLVEFCYQAVLPEVVKQLVDLSSNRRLPRVVGVRMDGTKRDWKPEFIDVVNAGSLAAPPCRFVNYRPPSEAVWRSVEIGPWARQTVGIVAVCGVDADVDEQRDEAEQIRVDAIDDWNNTPAPARFLLEADTEYEIDVSWEAITWVRPTLDNQPSQTERTPPNINSAMAADLPKTVKTDTFVFRTAPEETLSAEQPIDTASENTFDPRASRRYLTRVLPDIDNPPHFLEDPVSVVRNISYLDELLSKYGRELDIKVRRTDPPVASQVAVNDVPAPPPDTKPHDFFFVAVPIKLLDVIDARIFEMAKTPCLNPREPEGQANEYLFDLEPRAEYDLLVTAPKLGGGEEQELIIDRRHFSTSRFANALQMLESFALTEPTPGLSPPTEVLASPTSITNFIVGDVELDETMAALGLDPFAVATEPRIVTLIARTDKYEVIGVLIEADEPIQREGRCLIDVAKVVNSKGKLIANLVERRRSTSGTRVLLIPDHTIEATDQSYLLQIEMNAGREGRISGQRHLLLGGSSLAFEETAA